MEGTPCDGEDDPKEMEMEECKGGDVVRRTRLDDDEETELLPQDARRFRSIAARCKTSSQQTALTSISRARRYARRMSAPCESDWKMLRSIARYLRSHPRVLLQYKYQDPPYSMEAIVDTGLCWMQNNQKVHERRLCNARNAPHQELGNHAGGGMQRCCEGKRARPLVL